MRPTVLLAIASALPSMASGGFVSNFNNIAKPRFLRNKPVQSPGLTKKSVAATVINKPALPLSTFALPALSYAGLGAIVVGAVKVLAIYAPGMGPVYLIGGCVAYPVALLSAQLAMSGGPGIAKQLGGTPADARLQELAWEAADAVNVPRPGHIFEIPKLEPNAFAASGLLGGMSSTTVAVTSGLRRALNEQELKAVLAHEMGHLRYKDTVRNMHVAIAAAGMGGIYQAGRILFDASTRESKKSKRKTKDDDNDGSSGVALGLGLMGAGVVTQGVAHGVRLAASRSAELKADLAAAEAFGADNLISALQKIDRTAASSPSDLRKSAIASNLAHAMISDGPTPAASGARSYSALTKAKPTLWSRIMRAFRTHPPLDERVAALESAAANGLVPHRSPGDSWRPW